MKKKESKKKEIDSNKIIEIPVEGTLGLLALGAAGLRAWRKKKAEFSTDKKENKTDE